MKFSKEGMQVCMCVWRKPYYPHPLSSFSACRIPAPGLMVQMLSVSAAPLTSSTGDTCMIIDQINSVQCALTVHLPFLTPGRI